MDNFTDNLTSRIHGIVNQYSEKPAIYNKKKEMNIIQALQNVANSHQKQIDKNEKFSKLLGQILFYLASIGGFTAAIVEILHAKDVEEKGETQNWITPLCLVFVRLLMIPYFWRLYNISHVGKNPLFSSSPDMNIWTKIIAATLWFVAFGYAARWW